MLKIHPLIQQLSKLRESSKEAVADANIASKDELKNYLHIERQVERDLREIIKKSSLHDGPSLIMVCGNVGDGKSHLISKLRQDSTFANVLSKFNIHNDATESFSPGETCIDTLDRILEPFNDSQLGKIDEKWILAINLGTLSNFLEEKKSTFTSLYAFVKTEEIINPEKFSPNEGFIELSPFQYVNFTNHHFYSLNKNGVNATLLENLFAKVVSPTTENPLYTAYNELLKEEWSASCPVIANFEALSVEQNRKVLARLMVECILKEKRIISFRQILNFIYDILVPFELSAIGLDTYKKLISGLSEEQQLSFHLTNYIFERPHISKIFQSFHKLDPAVRRFEELDGRAIRIFSSVDKMNAILSDFPLLSPFFRKNLTCQNSGSTILHKTYLRLYYFQHFRDRLYHDDYFDEFARSLYYGNINDALGLRDINELVKTAVLLWNGSIKKQDKMMYNSISKNANYRLFRTIQLKAILPSADKLLNKTELHQFLTEVKVQLQPLPETSTDKKPFAIEVDYSLFVLFQMVKKGYRPNRLDRNSFVNFVTIVDSLTYEQSVGGTVFIDEINIGNPIDFELQRDEYGQFIFQKYNS
jgi:DNA phosphorothioation-dependent restriction protein DptF